MLNCGLYVAKCVNEGEAIVRVPMIIAVRGHFEGRTSSMPVNVIATLLKDLTPLHRGVSTSDSKLERTPRSRDVRCKFIQEHNKARLSYAKSPATTWLCFRVPGHVVDHLVQNQVVGTLDRLRREVNHLAVPQKSRKLDSESSARATQSCRTWVPATAAGTKNTHRGSNQYN